MSTQAVTKQTISPASTSEEKTMFRVLAAVSFCHVLNDMMQSLLPSIYPILKSSFHLNFTQIGFITLTFQITASLLQPVIGHYTDRKPMPYSLPIGMVFTLVGLLLLAISPTFSLLLLAAALIGMGSAVFHPESSRVARMASGGKHGFAQSFFQVGGNTGSAIGPLLAVFIVLPHGQIGAAWFSLAALLGIFVLIRVSRWYKARLAHLQSRPAKHTEESPGLPRNKVITAIAVLIALIFSKYFYLAGLTSYYTFYLISEVSRLRSKFAAPSLRLPRRGRRRNANRRPNRRPRRTQVGHLVLNSRRPALHPHLALRQSLLDRRAQHHHRFRHRICLLSHPCLCAGPRPRTSRNDLRPLLRICLRHGRHRRRSSRQTRRHDQHHLRLQSLRLSSRNRPPDRPSSQHEKIGRSKDCMISLQSD